MFLEVFSILSLYSVRGFISNTKMSPYGFNAWPYQSSRIFFYDVRIFMKKKGGRG